MQLHKRAEIGVEQVEGHIFRLKLDEFQTLLMQRVHCRQCRPGHITCIYPYMYHIFVGFDFVRVWWLHHMIQIQLNEEK